MALVLFTSLTSLARTMTMTLFGTGMSPRCLKFVFLTKESISDDEIMFNTIAEKLNSTSIDVSDAFLSYSALPEVLIPANPGIEVYI